MLVLDITKQQSFDNTKKWLANIEMVCVSDMEACTQLVSGILGDDRHCKISCLMLT